MTANWVQTAGGIEVATAATAREFVSALRLSNSHWWEGELCPWVFRGHASEEWKLLPSAWRYDAIMENAITEATRRFDAIRPSQKLNWIFPPNFHTGSASFGAEDAKLGRQLTIKTTAEYLLLWDFTNRCDELGMPVPLMNPGPDPTIDPNWLAYSQHPLFGDELLRFSDLPATLALAQHHGIPTRLLDWTRDPMAAAFFAIERLSKGRAGAHLAVWALHKRRAKDVSVLGVDFPDAPFAAQRVDSQIAIVRPSTRDNPFLASQAGLFTSIFQPGIHFMKSGGRRPGLEEFVAEAGQATTVLRKLRLGHEHLKDLLEILSRENISRSALMPTMDNVAQDIRAKWAARR